MYIFIVNDSIIIMSFNRVNSVHIFQYFYTYDYLRRRVLNISTFNIIII